MNPSNRSGAMKFWCDEAIVQKMDGSRNDGKQCFPLHVNPDFM